MSGEDVRIKMNQWVGVMVGLATLLSLTAAGASAYVAFAVSEARTDVELKARVDQHDRELDRHASQIAAHAAEIKAATRESGEIKNLLGRIDERLAGIERSVKPHSWGNQ